MSDTMTIQEAATKAGVTRQALYLAIINGRLLAQKKRLPGDSEKRPMKWRITLQDLVAYCVSKYSRDYSKRDGKLLFDKKEGWHSVSEVAKYLDMPLSHVYYALRKGDLACRRVGCTYVIHIDWITRYEAWRFANLVAD